MSGATVVAMVWANAAPASYRHFCGILPALPGPLHLGFSLPEWVEQGAVTGFFALVGLEIRREISAGRLRSWRRAAVPVVAALVGMAVPAGIYALIVRGSLGGRGWAPMATDVAFAVGALALLGRGRPPRLRVFLMTLAVVDDIASIAVSAAGTLTVLMAVLLARLIGKPLGFAIRRPDAAFCSVRPLRRPDQRR